MDQTTIIIIAGSIAFSVLLFFIVIRASKNKPLTVISEIAEDKKNPGLYHIFGSVTYMPDDAPSFEKYRHYLLNTSDMKVIKGLEQIGSDFDIRSPFAQRCVEHMKTVSGRDLLLEKEEEDHSDYDDEGEPIPVTQRNKNPKVKIVKHERGESDTSIPKVIKGNVVEVYDTSFGERDQFAMKITLDGLTFSIPKVKGMSDLGRVIWAKNQQKLFIFYSRMVMMKFGVGLLVMDTNSGAVISDDYFKQN
jgi:hypothetical protein